MKKEGSKVEETRKTFSKTIESLKKFKQDQILGRIDKTAKLDMIAEEEDHEDKSTSNHNIQFEKEEKQKLNKSRILQIKQRMATFKMKLYDKLDLKKILIFWIENSKSIKLKKQDVNIIAKKEEPEKTNASKKDEKKHDKKLDKKAETNVKYEYKKPDKDLLKILPFCNNIFSIQKSDN